MTMDVKQIAERFQGHHDAVMDLLQKSTVRTNALAESIADIEQKLARGGGGAGAAPKSWGEQFVASPELKVFSEQNSRPGRLRMEMKTTLTSASGSAGDLIGPQRDTLVGMPRRRLFVRDLLPTITATSGSIEYPRQTGRPINAGMVAEGASKPESEMTFELATTPVRTIAHWIPASRQVLDDVPQLQGLIDSELRYGLALKEEAQILSGDGTGQNLSGLITQATAFSAPITISSPNSIDLIALGILQCALADFPANGVVVHPSDWLRMRLLKGTDGKYLLGDPSANVPPQLFGVPLVPTPAVAVDKFLVGNFEAAATLYDRWVPRVEVSTEHADYFIRNLVAILAEERIALAVKQPGALVYGDFGLVT